MGLIVTLSLLALLFVLLEILVVPGLGIAGVIGFCFLGVGTYLVSMKFGLLPAFAHFIGLSLLFLLIFLVLFRLGWLKGFIRRETLDRYSPEKCCIDSGASGVCLTALRPGGRAVFQVDGQTFRLDVCTRGEFIDKDRHVIVEKIEGMRIIVIEKNK